MTSPQQHNSFCNRNIFFLFVESTSSVTVVQKKDKSDSVEATTPATASSSTTTESSSTTPSAATPSSMDTSSFATDTSAEVQVVKVKEEKGNLVP